MADNIGSGTSTAVASYLYLDGNRFQLRVNFISVETLRRVKDVEFMGGNPALDFADTIGGFLVDEPAVEDELLREYEDLVEFGLKTGTLSERSAWRLRRAARERPEEAERVLEDARAKRALIDAAFRPLSEGAEPPAPVLAELRDFGAEALTHCELAPSGDGFGCAWEHCEDLEAPLWPIAHAALELLTDGPLDRIKTCGRCRWLFIDTTKNHSRRWCSTEGCGTDEKKERYVARRRARRAGSPSA
jgi:predicted RNA-binding Zn ribbon-like protein